jgi:hypothetical protein
MKNEIKTESSPEQVVSTPGPWHVEKVLGRYEIWPKDDHEPHSYIALCQRKVNADLIAAAPALIDALKSLMPAIDPNERSVSPVIAKAREAIALAGGDR